MIVREMLNIVHLQLAADLNCKPNDMTGEKDSFIFTKTRDSPGRRPFPRNEQQRKVCYQELG